MKFKNIKISNFRNFEHIDISLDNKNVFFGMNDVGKTNFLYALRYLFDREVRKNNLVDTDFYHRNTSSPIEITICIDISDTTDSDSEKLRAKVKGAILSNQDLVYIKLVANYDKTEMFANPILYWGGDEHDLQEIKAKGYFYEIDYVFNVVYIDAYVDLYTLFKKNTAVLLKNDDVTDKDKLEHIDLTIADLNTSIASLSGIKNFEERVVPEYNSFRHDKVTVSVKSEIAVNGLYSNVAPYIKREGSDDLYPTSGEGRKKLLVYSIYDLLAEESSEKKINLPILTVDTNGMELYDVGEEKAWLTLFKIFAGKDVASQKEASEEDDSSKKMKIGVLGLTPHDVSDLNIEKKFRKSENENTHYICYGMRAGIDKVKTAGSADKNLVVAPAALETAKYLEKEFGTPYEVGYPFVDELIPELDYAGKKILIIHQQVIANAIRQEIRTRSNEQNTEVTVASWFMMKSELSEEGDLSLKEEKDYCKLVQNGNYDIVFADENMRGLVPGFKGTFVNVRHFAVSGKLQES